MKRKMAPSENNPGIGRCYLNDNFSCLPSDSEDLCNGRVLLIQVSCGEKCRAKKN